VSFTGWSKLDEHIVVANRHFNTESTGAHLVGFEPGGTIAWAYEDDNVGSVPAVVLNEVYVPGQKN
jgi:hypothetical protein